MLRYLTFCATLLGGCSSVGPTLAIPDTLLVPCAEPTGEAPSTEGQLITRALKWKNTAQCNASKITGIAQIIEGKE